MLLACAASVRSWFIVNLPGSEVAAALWFQSGREWERQPRLIRCLDWDKHFASRPHLTRKLLCDVRTADIYAWLSEIVATDRTEKNGLLGSATVKRLTSLLSGVFTHAVNLGYLNGVNPVVGAMLPAAAPPTEPPAYSLEEIRAMIAALPDQTSRVMLATAAFTGLSRSEIRGLEWKAIQGQELHVLRFDCRRAHPTNQNARQKCARASATHAGDGSRAIQGAQREAFNRANLPHGEQYAN